MASPSIVVVRPPRSKLATNRHRVDPGEHGVVPSLPAGRRRLVTVDISSYQALSGGLTDTNQLTDAVHEARKLLLRFRKHPLHVEVAGADRRLHEVPYGLVTGDGRDDGGIAGRGQ